MTGSEEVGSIFASAKIPTGDEVSIAADLLAAAVLAEDIIDDFLGHLSPDEQVACADDPKAAAALKALRAAIAKARTAVDGPSPGTKSEGRSEPKPVSTETKGEGK